jgi:adhesin/invasin
MRLWALWLAFGLAAAPVLTAAERERRYAPSVFIGGVVNGASFVPAPDNYVVSNGIISIFGEDLALRSRQVSQADLVAGRLPISLGGVSVIIGGQAAPLYFVSPMQINAQVPSALPQGEALLWINRENLISNKITVRIRQADPGLFTAAGRPVISHLDYSLVGRGETPGSTPAHPGEYVVLFMTALGPTLPAVIAGELPPFMAVLQKPTRVTIGGRLTPSEFVEYAGQAPGLAGVYQINLLLPGDTPAGDLEIQVEIDGLQSQPGMLLAVDR